MKLAQNLSLTSLLSTREIKSYIHQTSRYTFSIHAREREENCTSRPASPHLAQSASGTGEMVLYRASERQGIRDSLGAKDRDLIILTLLLKYYMP